MTLCLPKRPKICYLLTEANHWETAIIYRYALIMHVFRVQNPTENRKRNLWKGDFEGMRRHLHFQDWDLIQVGGIETKWLRFKAVLLDLVENFSPLARSKRPLAKPWISRRIIAMLKQKQKLYKKFLLTRSQEHWASYKHHDRLYTLSL